MPPKLIIGRYGAVRCVAYEHGWPLFNLLKKEANRNERESALVSASLDCKTVPNQKFISKYILCTINATRFNFQAPHGFVWNGAESLPLLHRQKSDIREEASALSTCVSLDAAGRSSYSSAVLTPCVIINAMPLRILQLHEDAKLGLLPYAAGIP